MTDKEWDAVRSMSRDTAKMLNGSSEGTRLAIRTKTIRVIENQLEVAAEQVIPTARFFEDLGADSLDVIEVVLALEMEFNIEISDEDAEKFKTVGDVFEYVEKHV